MKAPTAAQVANRIRRRMGWGRWALVSAVKERKLTYLDPPALHDLYEAIDDIENRQIPGRLIEAGVALGGSAIVMATALRPPRRLYAYDVFGMIPPPTDADGEDVQERYADIVEGRSPGIDGDDYYGYRPELRAEVEGNLASFGVTGVELVEGLFDDTLHVDEPVALAHIDGDWYESVRVCLERIGPHVSPGGRFVIDDYDAWSGCQRAVDEWMAEHGADFRKERHRRLHLVRQVA